MKNLILAITTILALSTTSCGDAKNSTSGTVTTGGKSYTCPMHPEVVSDKPGPCPKCGMNLVEMKQDKLNNEYFISFVNSPQTIEAGKEVALTFTPKIKGKENELVPLEVVHEHKIHVIVVSHDLSSYQHIHPEFNSDGSYSVKTTVRNGGKYVVFADYMPTGGKHMVDRFEFVAAGLEKEAKKYSKENLASNAEGYTVTLIPSGGQVKTKSTNHITGIVSQNGKEINANDLENIMGAKGHLILISENTQKFVHAHPDIVDGRLDLHADFEEAGIYRGFFQFKKDGKEMIADFVLNVKEGTASNSNANDPHQKNNESEHKH